MASEKTLVWYQVLGDEGLPEGRVKSVTAGHENICLARFEGRYCALQNACPHQGGPLGEGSIEDGWLRCPWHGWDYHPCTGKSPGGFGDGLQTYEVEERADGVYIGIEEEAPRPRTVTDVMAETMVNWGVTHVFGMVGHSNLGLADAVRVQEEAGKLRFIGVRHEGAAAFAASGYAKLTGKPAACLTIAGPGATNLLTGLWDAKVDRAPVLALTGQVETQVMGPGNFQEVDLSAAFQSVSAFSQVVLSESRHAELMTLALKHATLKRDVAHLVFPDEVQTVPAAEGAQASGPEGRMGAPQISPPEDGLADAVKRMRAAKRPLIVVGHGARFEMDAVLVLAEGLNAPVITTFKGKGLIPDAHPLAGGVLGRSGTPIASWFMNEADLLVVFGASFANHTGIASKKPIIQVDFDPMTLGKTHPVTLPLWGEIGVTARHFAAELAGHAAADPRAEVAERWALWRAEKASREADDHGSGVNSAAIFAALGRQVSDDAVIAVDVGNNTYSFGRYFECKRQAVLMSGYLGSIGFGFPAAMGAWAAAGDERQIVSVSGDGGFGQYMGELTTAVKYDMDMTHVLLNNSELGKISKEQRVAQFDVWQTSLHNPDFSAYATNCGALGIRVTEKAGLDAALEQALAHKGPALVEIMSDVELI